MMKSPHFYLGKEEVKSYLIKLYSSIHNFKTKKCSDAFFWFLFYHILTHFYGKKGVKVEISIDFVV